MKRIILLSLLAGVTVLGQCQQVLTLDQCREMALKNNLTMRSADNRLQQAQQQKKEAFTNYFPQISGTAATLHSNREMFKGNINTADVLPAEMASLFPAEMASAIPSSVTMSMMDQMSLAGVTAIQPIFAGGQIVNGNKLAKVGVEVCNLQKQQSENEVLLTVEKYYWQVVALKSKQQTLNAVAEMLKSIEGDAETAVAAGLALRNDLLQVQLKQNEVESNRIKLDNGLALMKMLLAQYIGLDANEDFVVAEEMATAPESPASLKQDASAVTNTPEYGLLQMNVNAATLQKRMEIGKELPSIGIGASYDYTHLLDADNHFGMIFATVSVPLSGWWGGSHAIKRKRLAEENARQMLTDNTELLKLRLQKNWNDLEDAYKQLQLAQSSIEQSTENLRINRDQYQAGTIKMSDLLQAETLYQQSQDKYIDAYTDFLYKQLEYKQSAGMR